MIALSKKALKTTGDFCCKNQLNEKIFEKKRKNLSFSYLLNKISHMYYILTNILQIDDLTNITSETCADREEERNFTDQKINCVKSYTANKLNNCRDFV